MTKKALDRELLVDCTQWNQATDQRQSLELKKTFRLQIKQQKELNKFGKKKKQEHNFEKAAEYKT